MKHLTLSAVLLLIACKSPEVRGIFINEAFVESQGYWENVEMATLIDQSLNQNSSSLSKLINYNCGGASYCYDLGGVITQIIWRIGEDNFIKMIAPLKENDKVKLRNLIEVGLEYSYQLELDIKNKKIQLQFPKVDEALK